eukprot:jgi/Tetstr1/449034/TSEL_036250.t1
MIKFASRPPTANIAASDLMPDRRNLAQLARFLQRVKEAVHGLICLELQDRTSMPQVTVSTYFADFADFQDRFIKELHGCSTMFVLINRFTDRLAISATDSSQPKNCVDLSQQVRRAYMLLPPADRTSEAAIIGTIMARLPKPTQPGTESSAIKVREKPTTFTIPDRHLKAVDAEFSAKRKADNQPGKGPPSNKLLH